jgi:hypothetical protein
MIESRNGVNSFGESVSIPDLKPRSQGYFSKPSFESALAQATLSGFTSVVKSVRFHCESVEILALGHASIVIGNDRKHRPNQAQLLTQISPPAQFRADSNIDLTFFSQ